MKEGLYLDKDGYIVTVDKDGNWWKQNRKGVSLSDGEKSDGEKRK